MKRVVLCCALSLLAACVNGYQQFYRPNPGFTAEIIAVHRAAPAPAVPLVDHVGSYSPQMINAYESNGYLPIGYSEFTSAMRQFGDGALEQGKKIGADLVVEINPKFAEHVSTVLPITTPTTSTSYTSGSATAFGPYGSTTAYGSATTTTYGTHTDYVPITIQRVEYGAVYFVKMKPGWGVMTAMLTDAQRQELQSNHGLNISVVVRGSAAFESDILPGDILLTMAGESVAMPADLRNIESRHLGQTVTVSLYRNGQIINKLTTLPTELP